MLGFSGEGERDALVDLSTRSQKRANVGLEKARVVTLVKAVDNLSRDCSHCKFVVGCGIWNVHAGQWAAQHVRKTDGNFVTRGSGHVTA